MAKKPSKKELAAKQTQELSADVNMFADDANVIDNNMGKDDLAIPRISILQALSPAVNKRKAEYIEGAEAGMFADQVQGKLYDGEEGIKIIPVTYRRTYIEWKDREAQGGGGFVADHGIDDELLATAERDKKGKLVLPDGNILVITAEYVILIIEDGVATPAVLSLSGSQLKKSKRWNTMISNLMIENGKGGRFNPAMFYRSYHFTTVPESNDQGDWFGVNIVGAENVTEIENGIEIYTQARDLVKQLNSGEVKVAEHQSEDIDDDEDAPL